MRLGKGGNDINQENLPVYAADNNVRENINITQNNA
jgi:hypothetical protein